MDKSFYYAVRVGRVPGIYNTRTECETQTTNFPGSLWQMVFNYNDALNFVDLDQEVKIPVKSPRSIPNQPLSRTPIRKVQFKDKKNKRTYNSVKDISPKKSRYVEHYPRRRIRNNRRIDESSSTDEDPDIAYNKSNYYIYDSSEESPSNSDEDSPFSDVKYQRKDNDLVFERCDDVKETDPIRKTVSPIRKENEPSEDNMEIEPIRKAIGQLKEENEPLKTHIEIGAGPLLSLIIYTAGAVRNGTAGWAYITLGQTEFYGAIPWRPSSNGECELYAIYFAIYYHRSMNRYQKLLIKTSSIYSINCITVWYKIWLLNGWKTAKGQQVLNKDIIEMILPLMDENIKFEVITPRIDNSVHERAVNMSVKGTMEYDKWTWN